MRDVRIVRVDTIDEVLDFRSWLGRSRPVLAVDLETTGLEWWSGSIRLAVVADRATAYVFPWERWSGVLHELLPYYTGPIVFHNGNFDLHFLRRAGLELDRRLVHDTLVQSHLLDPVARHGLKDLAVRHLDPRAADGQQTLHDGMRKHGWTWATVPYDFVPYVGYAGLDGIFTARLHEEFYPKVRTDFSEAYEVEMAVLRIVGEMEARGVRLDVDYAQAKNDELVRYVEQTKAWSKAEYGVSIGSNRQLAERLLADGVELSKLTSSGAYAMDEEVLGGLDHPLAQAAKSARYATKLSRSYFENLLSRLDDDGRVHCDVQTLGARTGRMSVRSPALQTLPRGPVVRDAFVPSDGNRLVSADYDQIEMRLLAHFAGEESMISAIRSGVDLHSHTARAIYGDGFTKDDRQRTKNVNFAKVYGSGVATFARTAGIPVNEAAEIMSAYDARFPGVRRFMREVEQVARRRAHAEGEAYVVTPLGRRHPLEQDALYKGVNYLIQGTAADLLKQALIRLDLCGFGETMLLPIHDEVLFDVPAEDAETIAKEVGDVMTDLDHFAVPITASADVMEGRWGDKYR